MFKVTPVCRNTCVCNLNSEEKQNTRITISCSQDLHLRIVESESERRESTGIFSF